MCSTQQSPVLEKCTFLCEGRLNRAAPGEYPHPCRLAVSLERHLVLGASHSIVSHGVIMQAAFLQATAEISAAPRPLPSSDWMKEISQFGVSSRTTLWKRSLKLKEEIWESELTSRLVYTADFLACTQHSAGEIQLRPQ